MDGITYVASLLRPSKSDLSSVPSRPYKVVLDGVRSSWRNVLGVVAGKRVRFVGRTHSFSAPRSSSEL